MTEPTALSQLRHLYQNMVNGAVRDTASAKRIAEGLLAPAIEALERGTPPAVAGEPVAYLHDDGYWTAAKTDAGRNLNDRLLFAGSPKVAVYTTPQPTQPQTGAVPLTCKWTHNDDDSSWDTECGQSWRFDDGGPKENHMNFCHCCGKTLRIKGGRHGTE